MARLSDRAVVALQCQAISWAILLKVAFRDLRHVTPFAGVLSASERAAAYRDFRRDEMQR